VLGERIERNLYDLLETLIQAKYIRNDNLCGNGPTSIWKSSGSTNDLQCLKVSLPRRLTRSASSDVLHPDLALDPDSVGGKLPFDGRVMRNSTGNNVFVKNPERHPYATLCNPRWPGFFLFDTPCRTNSSAGKARSGLKCCGKCKSKMRTTDNSDNPGRVF